MVKLAPMCCLATRRIYRRAVAAVLLASAVIRCGAVAAESDWIVRAWMSDDGLPNNNITDLAQTPAGYLWAANPWRLARFDGVRFDEIATRNILADHTEPISALWCASDGTFWLALDRGPMVGLKDGRVEVITNGLPDLIVESMRDDSHGAMWVAFRNGFVGRIENGGVTRMPWGNAASHSLARDDYGRVWLAQGNQVGIIRGNQFDVLTRAPNSSPQIARASGGGVWICSGKQLFRYDEVRGLQEMGSFQHDFPNSKPTVLLEDRQGAVWIGTSASRVFRYDGTHFEIIPTSHRQILALLEDREGNIWAGTGGGGLNRIQRRAVRLEDANTGLPFETIQSICEDASGVLWAVTQNGLLVSRKNDRWSTVADWPGGSAAAVTERSGAVWIGTLNHKLYRLKDGHFTQWQNADGLAARAIYALLVSRAGDLWIGGSEVLQRFRDGNFQTFKLPPGIRVIRAITEDAAGVIWIGTSDGALLRVNGDEVADEAPRLAGGRLSIRSLLSSPDGSVWIGYAGFGLGRLKDGKLARVAAENGLYDNHVSQIVTDGRGSLWLGADRGIFKIREKEFDDFVEGRVRRIHSTHYGLNDGLSGLQANFGAAPGALRSRDGRLWIPMRTALVVVDPAKIRADAEPPPVLLRSMTVDDQTLVFDRPVKHTGVSRETESSPRLAPGHHRIEFEFTALNFSSPENVAFQYRLDGVDRRWLDGGARRAASYSRLPAGNYRFRVIACNRDGVWNETEAALAFSVAPFFWQAWWFRLGALLTFSAALAALVRYISFRRLRLKVRELEQHTALDRERARIAKNLHDDLGGSLTEIGLRVKMASEDARSVESMKETTALISRRIRELARALDTVVWSVNPANDSLDRLASYLCGFFQEFFERTPVRFRVDAVAEIPPCRLTPEKRSHIFLTVKEAMTNILKHSRATEAWLRLELRDGRFCVTIEDNGAGFDPDTARGKARNGLDNMRSRVEELGGEFLLRAEVESGTKITFTIPMDALNPAPLKK